jgi:hypothetical protein
MPDQSLDRWSPGTAEAEAFGWLRRWHADGTTVSVYFATRDGAVGASMAGRITDITRCLVFEDDSSALRVDLANARLTWGPLRVLLTPSRIGRLAAVAQRPGGLLSREGVTVMLDEGYSVFVCARGDERDDCRDLVVGGSIPLGLPEP